jgi:hypothetical protein
LSTDGNFRLQRKHKNGDPDDVALNQGKAYFVENTKYKEYLVDVQPESQVCFIITLSLYVFILGTEIDVQSSPRCTSAESYQIQERGH